MSRQKINKLKELHEDKKLLKEYNQYILSELSYKQTINIGCVVTDKYIFDFLIFYFSILESWSFYPYLVHVFTFEEDTANKIKSFNLSQVEVHYYDIDINRSWESYAAMKVRMVELSGLERCIISDIDAIFLNETPELHMLLDDHDFVFIGAPHSEWIIQTSLWSFKRSRRSIKFAELWLNESLGRPHSDASGLPFALLKSRGKKLKIKVLAQKKQNGKKHHKCPYDVQANIRPFFLDHDQLGFKEKEMGRAKVYHFGGLRPVNHESVEDRMKRMASLYPESERVFGLYKKFAIKAAEVLDFS